MEQENLRQIAETLINLTILEARELGRILKEEHGIKPAVQQAHLNHVPVYEEEVAVQTEFDVIIKSVGSGSKLAVVKLVKELTSLGLREAKELVDSAPAMVREQVSESEDRELERQFEEIGVEIEIK